MIKNVVGLNNHTVRMIFLTVWHKYFSFFKYN